MGPKQKLSATLHNRGYRLTRQRQLILEILQNSRDHLDAEMVYAEAKKRDSRIGIATVYRTLAFLKKIGLAEENRLGEDHSHYEAADRAKPHYHFACLKCGRIVEFESPQVMRLARSLCDKEGLQVTEVSLGFRGYCKKCRPADAECGKTT